MSVSSVSLKEIKATRGTMSTQPQNKPKTKNPEKQNERYVDKFSDKKIADFFAPYGYISHDRHVEDGTIEVYCNDCHIIFDDFTLLAEPMINFYVDSPANFDFNGFAEICEQANMTPSQAISDRLESEVFNNMPYYIDKKRKYSKGNLANIAKHKVYGQLLTAAIEKKTYGEDFSYINSYYGTTDPEKVAETITRANSRN